MGDQTGRADQWRAVPDVGGTRGASAGAGGGWGRESVAAGDWLARDALAPDDGGWSGAVGGRPGHAGLDTGEQVADVLGRLRLRATLTERAQAVQGEIDGHRARPSGRRAVVTGALRWMVTPRVALAVVGMLAVVVAAACLTLVPAPASETAGADGDGLTGDGAVLSDEPGGVQLDGLPADPSGGAPDESGDPAGLEASPAASPAAIVVHVAGAVVAGGVVELPAGARVHEAVSAVGGARSDADLAAVNLARVLVDGERVYIPVPGETPPAVDEGPAGSVGMPGAGGLPPASGSGGGVNAELIDINTADAAALMELPGIGPVLADRIVAHRTANGPFPDVESLADVSGIGPAILDSVRDLVAVE